MIVATVNFLCGNLKLNLLFRKDESFSRANGWFPRKHLKTGLFLYVHMLSVHFLIQQKLAIRTLSETFIHSTTYVSVSLLSFAFIVLKIIQWIKCRCSFIILHCLVYSSSRGIHKYIKFSCSSSYLFYQVKLSLCLIAIILKLIFFSFKLIFNHTFWK